MTLTMICLNTNPITIYTICYNSNTVVVAFIGSIDFKIHFERKCCSLEILNFFDMGTLNFNLYVSSYPLFNFMLELLMGWRLELF